MKLTDKQISRFWARVDKRQPEDCWEWKAARSANGYGVVSCNGRFYRSSRLAYFLHHKKELPPQVFLCHTCDNPACCNPSHLWEGDNASNQYDAICKGRMRLNTHNRSMKLPFVRWSNKKLLTDAQIKEVRDTPRRHKLLYELAEKYGVSRDHINKIRSRQIRKKIT